eukprot:9555812-Karenia_brevis.AAC.1
MGSLCDNALLYNAQLWSSLTKSQLATLESRFLSAYRRAFDMPYNNPSKTRFCDEQVLIRANGLNVEGKLCVLRLRYLGRMLVHGP